MVRICIVCLALLLAMVALGSAQPQGKDLSSFLTIPDPDCGIYWHMKATWFDSLRANPAIGLIDLKHRIERLPSDSEMQRGSALLELSNVYREMDSTGQAEMNRKSARSILLAYHAKKPSALSAYLIGEATDNSDSACYWYEQAIAEDSLFYLAYFALIGEHEMPSDPEQMLWMERTASVTKLLMESATPRQKAEILYATVDMQAGLRVVGMVMGMFQFMIDSAGAVEDTGLATTMVKSSFKGISASFCSAEQASLVSQACALDPENVTYRLHGIAIHLGKIFFGMLDDAMTHENEIGESSKFFESYFRKHLEEIRGIDRQLSEFDASYCLRYPVIHFYRAMSKEMIGDLPAARQEITTFISLRPDVTEGYSMHCGLMVSLAQKTPELSESYVQEVLDMGSRKCESMPCLKDCYRTGVICWMQGNLSEAMRYFQSAMYGEKEDYKPAIGMAVCAYQMGDVASYNTYVGLVERKMDDLPSNEKTTFAMLRSVSAASIGDYESARYWAQVAIDTDSEKKEAKLLMDALR